MTVIWLCKDRMRRKNARIVSHALLTDWYCWLFTSFTQEVMGMEGAEDICDYTAMRVLGRSLLS